MLILQLAAATDMKDLGLKFLQPHTRFAHEEVLQNDRISNHGSLMTTIFQPGGCLTNWAIKGMGAQQSNCNIAIAKLSTQPWMTCIISQDPGCQVLSAFEQFLQEVRKRWVKSASPSIEPIRNAHATGMGNGMPQMIQLQTLFGTFSIPGQWATAYGFLGRPLTFNQGNNNIYILPLNNDPCLCELREQLSFSYNDHPAVAQCKQMLSFLLYRDIGELAAVTNLDENGASTITSYAQVTDKPIEELLVSLFKQHSYADVTAFLGKYFSELHHPILDYHQKLATLFESHDPIEMFEKFKTFPAEKQAALIIELQKMLSHIREQKMIRLLPANGDYPLYLMLLKEYFNEPSAILASFCKESAEALLNFDANNAYPFVALEPHIFAAMTQLYKKAPEAPSLPTLQKPSAAPLSVDPYAAPTVLSTANSPFMAPSVAFPWVPWSPMSYLLYQPLQHS